MENVRWMWMGRGCITGVVGVGGGGQAWRPLVRGGMEAGGVGGVGSRTLGTEALGWRAWSGSSRWEVSDVKEVAMQALQVQDVRRRSTSVGVSLLSGVAWSDGTESSWEEALPRMLE